MRKRWICIAEVFTMIFMTSCGNISSSADSAVSSPQSSVSPPTVSEASVSRPASSSVSVPPASPSAAKTPSSPVPFELLSFNVTQFYDSETDGDIYIYGSYYPSVSLSEKKAADYIRLDTALKNYSESLASSMKVQKDTLMPEIRASDSSDTFQSYYFSVSVSFQRADSTAVSFIEEMQSFTGGVHGNSVYKGRNFNSETGQEIKLTDVMPDISSLPDTLSEKLHAKYPDIPFTDLKNTLRENYPHSDGSDFSWTLGYHELTFYFSPYEIAPYAAGLLTVAIPFKETPELFEAAYTVPPKAYVAALIKGEAQNICTDENGTPVSLKADLVSDDSAESGYGKRVITLGANTFSFEEDNIVYSFRPYFLHLSDNRNFLYLDCSADNDYHTIEVYKIDGGTVSYMGLLENAGAEEGGITDPDSFPLSSRLDLLSTYSGTKYCHTGADGIPVADDTSYRLSEKLTLTSRKDMTVPLLNDSYQTVSENITVPAGTEFTLSRSDGTNYVDAVLADGRLCRLELDNDGSWPQTIGGEEIENLFDGLRFAG